MPIAAYVSDPNSLSRAIAIAAATSSGIVSFDFTGDAGFFSGWAFLRLHLPDDKFPMKVYAKKRTMRAMKTIDTETSVMIAPCGSFAAISALFAATVSENCNNVNVFISQML